MFTVVIATHNRHEKLSNALQSVFTQTVLPNQIIVVDDGSERAVSKSVFDECPDGINCLLLRVEEPRGVSNARNLGVANATQDYIAFLDDDDEFLPRKIEVIRSSIRDEICDLYFHPYEARFPIAKTSYIVWPFRKDVKITINQLFEGNFVGGPPVVVVSKRTFLEVGGFDTRFPALEDYELWIRLLLFGAEFRFIAEPLSRCYFDSNSTSLSKSREKETIAVKLLESIYHKELSKLSLIERDKYENHKRMREIYQYQMVGDNFKACIISLRLAAKNKSPSLLLRSVSLLFGFRGFVWLAKIKSHLRPQGKIS